MKVKFIGRGCLKGEKGETYICDADGFGGVVSEDTGEMYVITARDENEDPVEIEPVVTLR